MLTVLGLLTACPCAQAQPESGRELLDFVREAHRATREGIRTFSCKLEFRGASEGTDSSPPKSESCSASYWFGPSATRFRVTEFGMEADTLWRDSVRTAVVRNADGHTGANRSQFASRFVGRCDAWARALLAPNLPGTIDSLPFEQITAAATNYLIRKVAYVSHLKAGTYRSENEVAHFKECSPGVFFPERLEGRYGNKDAWTFKSTTVLSDIRINPLLPENVFRLSIPHGVTLVDGIRGVSYKVDSAGRRISAEEPLGRIPPPPVGASAEAPRKATQFEPTPASWWVLPVSAAVLVFGITAYIVRRMRGKED